MVLILDTTIGFSILLPFTLGKSTALLTVCPYGFTCRANLTNAFVAQPTANDPTGPFPYSSDPICH